MYRPMPSAKTQKNDQRAPGDDNCDKSAQQKLRQSKRSDAPESLLEKNSNSGRETRFSTRIIGEN
jgi:hypothetical protein